MQSEFEQKFSPDDWAFLAALPYRLGLWMSQLDLGGGDTTHHAEMKALHDEIMTIQRKYQNVPALFDLARAAQNVMDTTAFDPALPKQILSDCGRALKLLQPHLSNPDMNCFKLMMIDIAEYVARAGPEGELAAHNLHGGVEKGWYGFLSRVARWSRGPRVSRTEKAGINQLIETLGATDLVKPWLIEGRF